MNFLRDVLNASPFWYPLFFQGPAATVVVFLLWRDWVHSRTLDKPAALSSGVARSREALLYSGLILFTVATALDWISIVADYLKPSNLDVIEAAETGTKIVSGLCGTALILSIAGRGLNKGITVVATALLLVGSLELVLIEGCRHTSM